MSGRDEQTGQGLYREVTDTKKLFYINIQGMKRKAILFCFTFITFILMDKIFERKNFNLVHFFQMHVNKYMLRS